MCSKNNIGKEFGFIDSKKLDFITPDKITRFYVVPSARFESETKVLEYYGYRIGDKFSEGGFSSVHYATHISTNVQVACKKIDLKKSKSKPKPSQSKIEDLKNELFILKKLNHPYIVKLYCHFVINTDLYIFLKLANAGTLAKHVKKRKVLSERESQLLFGQILVAFEYLHSLNIAHRDMKLENVLLLKHPNKLLTILLTDFGLSRVISRDETGNDYLMCKTYCGTFDYMAPEVLQGKPYNGFKVDIWALGIALYVMLNSKFPFEAKEDSEQIKLQMSCKWQLSDNVLENPSNSLIHMLTCMLDPNPNSRINITKLITHPWIVNEYRIAKLLNF